MNKLNVLFLNSWYPNDISPYNGNFVQQHARAVSIYTNVICLQTQSREQKQDLVVSRSFNEGVLEITVYYKKIKSKLPVYLLIKKQRQHKAFLKGFEVVKKEFLKIDLVHLNVTFPAGMFALYLKNNYNLPYIITEHSTLYLESNSNNHARIQKYLIRKIAKKASTICTVSSDLMKAMLKYGIQTKFEVVSNVVNTNIFKYTQQKKSDFIKILHVSSLKDEHKNYKGILNVIKKLSEIRQDFKLTIISVGNLKPVVEYANSIGLSNLFFTIEGGKSSNEIAIIMQEHHLLLLFSNYENLPCVISEALVSGLPVISSEVGGVNEMISNENGILVAAKDENELLNKLNYIMDNLANYKNEEISIKAIKRYNYEEVGMHFFKIYKDVLNF